jgi:hypothetical protein
MEEDAMLPRVEIQIFIFFVTHNAGMFSAPNLCPHWFSTRFPEEPRMLRLILI